MSALTIILIIIVVILVILYLYRIISNYRKSYKKRNKWPPIGSPLPCPDYWIDKGSGACENTFLLGTGQGNSPDPIKSMNFNSYGGCAGQPNSKSCLNNKCTWARNTNNPWFGVLGGCKEGQNCYCPG